MHRPLQRIGLALACFFSLAGTANAAIKGETVEYKSGDTVMKGYIAYDDAIKGERPGILVVHEWWGHNDYARKRAEQIAALGYTAMALDMYGKGKLADHPKQAGEFKSEVVQNWDVGKARFMAAYDVLAKHPTVDASKMAAIGYCFGGEVVLKMARTGVDLDGVVVMHGSVATSTPAKKGDIKAKIRVYNGAADVWIKPESVTAFKKEMDDAGVDYEYVSLEGAKHAFTNPAATENGKKFGIPIEYNEAADKKSWEGMKAFFDKLFN